MLDSRSDSNNNPSVAPNTNNAPQVAQEPIAPVATDGFDDEIPF